MDWSFLLKKDVVVWILIFLTSAAAAAAATTHSFQPGWSPHGPEERDWVGASSTDKLILHRIMLLHTLQVTAEVATLRLHRSPLASLLLPSRCGNPSGQRIPCYMGPEGGSGASFIGTSPSTYSQVEPRALVEIYLSIYGTHYINIQLSISRKLLGQIPSNFHSLGRIRVLQVAQVTSQLD